MNHRAALSSDPAPSKASHRAQYFDSANMLAHKYETIFCIFLLILVYLCRENTHLVYPQILYLFVLLLALNLAAGLTLRLGYIGELMSAALIMGNCATITAILSYSGGQESNLWVLYLLPINTACILLGGREVAWITLGAVCFNLVHYVLSGFSWGVETYFAISLESAIFIFAAMTTWKMIVRSRSAHQEFEVQLAQGERRLTQTQAQLVLFRKLLDQFSEAIVVIDPAVGRVLDINEAFCVTLGYTRDEVMQYTRGGIDALIPPGSSWADFVRRLREERSLIYECFPKRKDGTIFPMEVNMKWVYQERNDYLIAIGRDITERKRAEKEKKVLERQLIQAQKMEAVGQLAGGVAHDFNNLLTAILGYSQFLETSLEPSDPRLDDIKEIVNASNRAAALTGQLLAFSRRQMLAPKIINLNMTVESLQKMLKRLISEDLYLEVSLDPGLKNVKADAGQIEQVIMNLVVNARDATPVGGTITLETKNIAFEASSSERHEMIPPGVYAMIAVSDTGHGMGPETMAHLFEPFFTTKDPGKGTGLGLSTAYGIVKQSGGYIWAYSEPKRGSTFKVYLPISAEAVDGASGENVPIRSLRGSETILIAEDNDSVRQLLVRTLQRNGYTILEARDGKDALKTLEREATIDLILTDIVMPQLGGRALADYVKATRPKARIIFMSGYTDDVVLRQGVIESGMMFMQKPITPDMLLRQVRCALDGLPAAPSASARLGRSVTT